ncbi:MAG: hypothetical protein DMG08_18580 [Acidobacteria bacterium]|nr:MAG: hypothetical protein DMG08_18580 [Acidobacteriota bacterium]
MLLHLVKNASSLQDVPEGPAKHSPLRSLRSDEEFPFLIPPIALARGTTNLTNCSTATVRERHDFLRRAFKTSFYL